jgi:hypothetical protein
LPEPARNAILGRENAGIWRMSDYANRLADAEALGFDLEPLRALVRADLEHRAFPARVLPAEAKAMLDEWRTLPSFDTFQRS